MRINTITMKPPHRMTIPNVHGNDQQSDGNIIMGRHAPSPQICTVPPPSGFFRCSQDDCALLPASVRAIADALAHEGLALLEPRGAACVRSAVAQYAALVAAGLPNDEVFVALGRVRDDHGVRHDHAWVLAWQTGAWTVEDRAVGARLHEPLVLLSSEGVWTSQPVRLLPTLRPEFFLTMHCQINDKALKGLLEEPLIDDINHMNSRVDDPFSHPNYDPREHFDNALIVESIALLEDRLTGAGRLHTIDTGVSPAIPYGLACHAIADFYSHTNYAPMALEYYKTPERVLTIDEAVKDPAFLQFVTESWQNASMWHDYDGYSRTTRPEFGPGFEQCLFSGGYGGDGWTPRDGIPHHDDFAVDQLSSAWTRADKILPRRNPFAPPGPWAVQFRLRFRLAVDHLRAVLKRFQKGDPTPFLGAGQTLPAVLVPPVWTLAASRSCLVRGADGQTVTIA